MEQEITSTDLSEFSYFKLRVLWMILQKFIMDLFTGTDLTVVLYYASDSSKQPILRP